MAPRDKACSWGGCDVMPVPGSPYCATHRARAVPVGAASTTSNGDLFPELLPASSGTPDPVRVPVRAHLRTIANAIPKPDGIARREQAHAAHQENADKLHALNYVRGQLADLYLRRARMYGGETSHEVYVTSDDAYLLLREWAQMPSSLLALPTQSWMGSIFRGAGWAKIEGRMVKSDPKLRPTNHGALIACWRYTAPRRRT